MSSIFELTREQVELQNLIEKSELSEEMARDTLEGLAGEMSDKFEAYCAVLTKMNAQAEALKNEKERVSKLESEKKNEIARLKSFLVFAMQATEQQRVDTGLHKISLRKGRESLKSKPNAVAPDEYVITEIVEKKDAKAITQAIKDGKAIKGFWLERGDSTVVIK